MARAIGFIVFNLLMRIVSSVQLFGYVLWEENKPAVRVISGDDERPSVYVARGSYDDQINTTGWSYLEVHTSGAWTDRQQAYSAGYLEGHLTRDLIWYHYQNMLKGYCIDKASLCAAIEEFIDLNDEFVTRMVRENNDDPYWYQVQLVYIQLEGLAYGYNSATSNALEKLTLRDIFWINLLGDLDELALSLSLRLAPTSKREKETDPLMDHCSGIVKLLPDWSELFVAHTTWNSYQSMLRVHKLYVINYNISSELAGPLPGFKCSFTSYPGFLHSADDMYVLSSGLVVAETTIGNSNWSLYSLVRPRCVFEFVRVMVACRMADHGAHWVRLFARHNSGTYNNQWYIVDYNRFSKRRRHVTDTSRTRDGHVDDADGLLWLAEQLPGHIEAADLTNLLVKKSYFASYNIPYLRRSFELNGGRERVRTYGDWFGYRTNPRAVMFREKQGGVHNLRDVLSLIRHNDYKRERAARCASCRPPYSACNAICARNDLNPSNGTYPFRQLGHRSHGGTDGKVTSDALRVRLRMLAVSGPTYCASADIPPFQWSKFDMEPEISHVGHPDLWTFSPVTHSWGPADDDLKPPTTNMQHNPIMGQDTYFYVPEVGNVRRKSYHSREKLTKNKKIASNMTHHINDNLLPISNIERDFWRELLQ